MTHPEETRLFGLSSKLGVGDIYEKEDNKKTYRRRQPHSPGLRQGSQERWPLHPQSNHHGDHHEDPYLQSYYKTLIVVTVMLLKMFDS